MTLRLYWLLLTPDMLFVEKYSTFASEVRLVVHVFLMSDDDVFNFNKVKV